MQVAQFLTIKNINCLELMQSSKFWDKKSPILKDHELVSIDDLTHNEVVLRQLNHSIILRNLIKEIQEDSDLSKEDFSFPRDFYGDSLYWMRMGYFMRLILLVFLLFYST